MNELALFDESWKERWQEASFRGVKFLTESLSTEGGRRTIVHEYPFRDEPNTEDMGLKARKYTVNAYVIGDDHDLQRNSLLKALEKKGAGDLVHPEYALQRVVSDSFTITTNEQQRITRFAISFKQAGAVLYPGSQRNVKADLITIHAATQYAINQRTAGVIEQGITLSQIKAQTATLDSSYPAVGLDSPETQANGLPVALENTSLMDSFAAASALESAVMEPVFVLLPALPENWTEATESPLASALNSAVSLLNELAQLEQTAALIQHAYPSILAHVLASTAMFTYESVEQAQNLRQQMHDHLQNVSEWLEIPLPSAPVLAGLRDLLVIVDEAAEQQLNTLPHAFFIELPAEQPVLTLAWDSYHNEEQSGSLQSRNPHIIHPLFISTSHPVEILK